MTSKCPSNLQSRAGFFRSTTAVALAGLTTGFAVTATAAQNHSLDFKAALATITSAAVVAFADWLVRRRAMIRHEDNVSIEHEKTRELIRAAKRKPRKKTLHFKA